MRLFSWAGGAALAAAAAGGYLASEAVHRGDPIPCPVLVCDAPGGGELSELPPGRLAPPQPVEEIDLSCPTLPVFTFSAQSTEPPLADQPLPAGTIRTVNFELPAGPPEGPELPPATMPHITDDPVAPATLPPAVTDAPAITPVPVTPPGTVDLGKPPTSEHPSAVKPAGEGRAPRRLAPIAWLALPPRWWTDTMEVRPGDLPPARATAY